MSLEKLESKVEDRRITKNKVKDADVKITDTDKIIEEVKRNYRLINNTTSRIEKQNQYIEDKVNVILSLLKYKDMDTQDIKKLQEIEELENKLKELKRGN